MIFMQDDKKRLKKNCRHTSASVRIKGRMISVRDDNTTLRLREPKTEDAAS